MSSSWTDMAEATRQKDGAPAVRRPAQSRNDDYFSFGHCSPGSTFLKLSSTLTEPSAATCPRYMVSGAWRCFDIWMVPRGPSTETSASALMTDRKSVV